jgi:hypothetical protein
MRASMPRVVQRVGKVVDVSRREVLIFICICSLGAFDGSVVVLLVKWFVVDAIL